MLLAMGQLVGQAGFDFGDLIYGALILLAILGGLGKQIRDKYQNSKTAPTKTPAPLPPTPNRGTPAGLPQSAGRLDPSQAEVILAELFDLPTARRRRAGSRPEGTQQFGKTAAPVQPPARPGEARRPESGQPDRTSRGRPQRRRPKGSVPPRPQAPQSVPSARPQPPQPVQPARKPEAVKGRVDEVAEESAVASVATRKHELTVTELRRAIIMSEILAPPVALRGQSHSF